MPRLAKPNFGLLLPGALALLVGGAVLAGWFFDFPALTRINPAWNPMVPGTALGFMLSGLSLLAAGKPLSDRFPVAPRLLVTVVVLLAATRLLELSTGREFGVEFLLRPWVAQREMIGHMSPLTAVGFLLFGSGMLASQRQGSRSLLLLAAILAYGLMVMGFVVIVGYYLNLPLFFESAYIRTGLIWMSLPTAIGMALLGVGLQGQVIGARRISDSAGAPGWAPRIYRSTIIVVAVTSIATGLAGLKFLEATLVSREEASLAERLDDRSAHIATILDNRIQRALVAGRDVAVNVAAAALLRAPRNHAVPDQALDRARALLAYGFTGVGVEEGGRRRLIAGRLLPPTVASVPLHGNHEASLSWDKGYYLRVQLPVDGLAKESPQARLVVEQALPSLDQLFDAANRWGKTGSMPMCARLDRQRLLCFPQREQSGMYVVPDSFEGKPIPMAYALNGQRGVRSLVDYRGHQVLAAYAPVGKTDLGLVLRIDMAEVYAPTASELRFALPFIAALVVLGLWYIRLRVRPLIRELSSTYAAERAARARFDAAMQSSPDGFVIQESEKNQTGEIVGFRYAYANQQAAEIAGLPAARLLGRSFLEIFPEQREVYAKYRRVALTGEPLQEEFSAAGPMGERWYVHQAVAMPGGVAITFRDITREKSLLQKLEYSNRLLTAIVESAAYSIISTDVNGTIMTFNHAAERMLWYRADEVIGKATPEIFHDAGEIRHRAEALSHELGRPQAPGFEVFVAKAKTGFQEEHEWTYVRKDGSRFPVRLSVTALRDANNALQGFLGIAYDISEQKRTEEYIRHIALHDVLTGLPNRALLDDRALIAIEQHRRNNASFALVMLDIDHFKHINDSMGHHVGDRLLKEFVQRVKSCLRPSDTLARMGGDEFVLLLPETDQSEAELVLERVLHALMPPINVALQEIHVTSSIGISIFPRDGQNVHELLRCADVAMYWVKAHGRNAYRVFSRDMDRGGTDRLRLERALHRALDNDGFMLFYQPKVNLKTKTVFGVEALLRMRMPDGQLILPAEFIPLAEETGLIVRIGAWVLDTACRDAARMRQVLGRTLGLAVNVSSRQFLTGNLIGIVRDALRHSNLEAGQLEIEITESVLLDERGGVASAVNDLHKLGVRLAIDDFGTGYSSLAYLKRYPVDTLKIDQSFVRDIPGDAEDSALVAAIIAIGHSLNIPVVAEGIETEEQLLYLDAQGCDGGQGFYVGTPMSFEALMQWFGETDWSSAKVGSLS